jgi:hypothetical protein
MKKILILLCAVLIITGCKESSSNLLDVNNAVNNNNSSTGIESIKYEEIARGSNCGINIEKNYVIKNDGEWKAFWAELNKNQSSIKPQPIIDFNQDMIIAITLAQKNSGGYSIQIDGLINNNRDLAVSATMNEPQGGIVTQAITQPYVVIKTKKLEKIIKFNIN